MVADARYRDLKDPVRGTPMYERSQAASAMKSAEYAERSFRETRRTARAALVIAVLSLAASVVQLLLSWLG